MTIIKRSYRQFLLVVVVIATLLGAKGLNGSGIWTPAFADEPTFHSPYAKALAHDIPLAPDFEQFQPIQFKVVEGNDPNHPAVEFFARSLPGDYLCGQPDEVKKAFLDTAAKIKMISWGKPLIVVSLPSQTISAIEWDKEERKFFGVLSTALSARNAVSFELRKSSIGGAVIDEITDELHNPSPQERRAFGFLRYEVSDYASCDSSSGFMVVKTFVFAARVDIKDTQSGEEMKPGIAENIAGARLAEMENEFAAHGDANGTAEKYGNEVVYAMISVSFRPNGSVELGKYAHQYAHEVVRQVKAILYKLAKVPAPPEDKPVQEAEL